MLAVRRQGSFWSFVMPAGTSQPWACAQTGAEPTRTAHKQENRNSRNITAPSRITPQAQYGFAEQKFGTVARPVGLSITAKSAGFSFHSQRALASSSRFCLNASTHFRM